MPPPKISSDTQLQNLIERGLNGDSAANDALLDHACDRLLRLTRKMLHGYPNLRRWEQTDDVLQNSMLRLHRAMSAVQVESVRHFFNLAAVQLKRTGGSIPTCVLMTSLYRLGNCNYKLNNS